MPTTEYRKFEERFAKRFGEKSIHMATDADAYEVIPTGSLALDYALGVGGYVEGRLVEIWGVDAIGKSTLALQAIGEAQRKHADKLAAWIDMEQVFDLGWAMQQGVDPERLTVMPATTAEDVADAMKEILVSGLFSIVVLDSIGAMIPQVEVEKGADEATMAVQAKIVTRMVKIAAPAAAESKTVVLLLNQVRANLSYGATTTTGGGFALKHVTTHKLKLKRTGTKPYTARVPGEKEPVEVGHELAILVERNKVAPPKRTAIVSLFHTESDAFGPPGIDRVDEAVTMGLKLGVIEQAGPYYTLPDQTKLQGRDKLVAHVREHPELLALLRERVLAATPDVEPEPQSKFRTGGE